MPLFTHPGVKNVTSKLRVKPEKYSRGGGEVDEFPAMDLHFV